jgi:hypothetical protein
MTAVHELVSPTVTGDGTTGNLSDGRVGVDDCRRVGKEGCWSPGSSCVLLPGGYCSRCTFPAVQLRWCWRFIPFLRRASGGWVRLFLQSRSPQLQCTGSVRPCATYEVRPPRGGFQTRLGHQMFISLQLLPSFFRASHPLKHTRVNTC